MAYATKYGATAGIAEKIGDRDWDAITAWAQSIASALQQDAT